MLSRDNAKDQMRGWPIHVRNQWNNPTKYTVTMANAEQMYAMGNCGLQMWAIPQQLSARILHRQPHKLSGPRRKQVGYPHQGEASPALSYWSNLLKTTDTTCMWIDLHAQTNLTGTGAEVASEKRDVREPSFKTICALWSQEVNIFRTPMCTPIASKC